MANKGPRAYLAELRDAVFRSKAETTPAVREAAARGEPPADLAALVDKIRKHAYKVTDEDIAAAKAAGHSEDEIFEITCAAALGVAIARLDRAFAVAKLGEP
jgi:hypothetical protein